MAESEEELKSLLMKVKEESENVGLKLNIQKTKLSSFQLFVTPWTVAHQAPPTMGFSRQEYWSGLPFHSPGGSSRPSDRTQGLNLGLLHWRQML